MSTTTPVEGLLNGTVALDIPTHTDLNAWDNAIERISTLMAEILGPGVFKSTDWNGSVVASTLAVDISTGAGFIGDAGTRRPVQTTGVLRITSASGLADATTNYVFKNRSMTGVADSDFVANQTGTPPANTHLVMTVVTSGGQATSINNAPSGRVNLGLAALGGSVLVANVNPVGGVPFIHRVTCSALTGDVDVTLTHKTRILDVHAIATAAGGAGDTVTVKNGATAITNALDLNVADQAVVRAGTINDAQWDIASGGTLRVTGASGVNAEVIIQGIRVA